MTASGAWAETASLVQSLSLNDRQKDGAGFASRRLSHGRGLAPHQSNPASMHCFSLMAGNLPASAIRRSSRPFIPAHCHGANRRSAHTLPVEQVFQGIAHRVTVHLSNVLSEGAAVRENSCEPKGLGNVRKAFGELRNV